MDDEEKMEKKDDFEDDIEFLDEGEENSQDLPSYQKFKAFFS